MRFVGRKLCLSKPPFALEKTSEVISSAVFFVEGPVVSHRHSFDVNSPRKKEIMWPREFWF